MPPRAFSRYEYCAAVTDADGNLYLTDRTPFRFVARPDNRQHQVVQGDTLFGLAARYFAPHPNAPEFWFVIADFQPDPILDPTLSLELGRMLVIPSLQMVTTEIFNEARRNVG